MIPYDCLADLTKELHTTSPNQSYPTKDSDSEGTDAVSETKDPVSETKDPVSETKDPVSETKDPVSESTNPVSETKDQTSESADPVSETPKSDWIESVASLSCISSLMCDCQALVDDAKKSILNNGLYRNSYKKSVVDFWNTPTTFFKIFKRRKPRLTTQTLLRSL